MESRIIELANLIIFLDANRNVLKQYDREKQPEQHKLYRTPIVNEIKLAIKNGLITEDEGLDLCLEFTRN